MKYSVSNEGVEALRRMAQQVTQASSLLQGQAKHLSSFTSDYDNVLGPHKQSIDSALADISSCINKSVEPANNVAGVLTTVADRYQNVIDTSRFGKGAGGSAGTSGGSLAGGSGSGSSGSGSGGGWGPNTDSDKFGPFDTGVFKNGAYIVKGDNYDKFYDDYYNAENSTYESLGDGEYVEVIPPSKIEGISLGPTEKENSGVFWSQHDKEGTADSFKDIASKIPIVSSQLREGKSLSEIRSDPSLGKTVSIYFDPANMVEVEKWGDYYVFNTNGRHRILAARDMGYDIPVKVIGIRRW